MQQFKIDLALIEIDAHQPDPQAITESVAHAAAAAIEPMSALVVLVVVVLQRGHVHETVDIQAGQFDEQAERCDAGNNAIEFLADAMAHVLAFEPGRDLPRRLVGRSEEHTSALQSLMRISYAVF